MAAPPQQLEWKRQRILLLDLDDQFRFWARGLFNRLGVAEVISTASGFDALHALDRTDATLAMVDLQIKGMTAAEFIKAVRGKRRLGNLPVMLLVKTQDKQAIYDASLEGIEGIIVKPIAEKAMLSRVVTTLLQPQRIVLNESFAGPDRRNLPRIDPEPAKPAAAPVPRTKAVPTIAAKPVGKARPKPAGAVLKPQGKGAPARREAAPTRPVEPLETAPVDKKPKVRGWDEEDVAATPPPVEVRDYAAEIKETPKAKAASKEDWDAAVAPKPKKEKKKKKTREPSIDLPGILEAHQAWLASNGQEGEKARLEGADLAGADLAGANLVNASLRGANLSDSDCSGAQMTSAEMRRANLSGASLAGADLSYATLRHVNLTLADLSGASLVGADLAGATFAKANVQQADLTSASLLGADLDNADLEKATGLTQTQVGKAYGTKTTKLPAGLRAGSPEEWSEKL